MRKACGVQQARGGEGRSDGKCGSLQPQIARSAAAAETHIETHFLSRVHSSARFPPI